MIAYVHRGYITQILNKKWIGWLKSHTVHSMNTRSTTGSSQPFWMMSSSPFATLTLISGETWRNIYMIYLSASDLWVVGRLWQTMYFIRERHLNGFSYYLYSEVLVHSAKESIWSENIYSYGEPNADWVSNNIGPHDDCKCPGAK